MYTVRTFDSLTNVAKVQLSKKNYIVLNGGHEYDAAFVRYTSLLGERFPETLKCIARAGFSTVNVPLEECTKKGIVIFHTPGATSNAVKELVLCGLLLSSRRVLKGANWLREIADDDDLEEKAEDARLDFLGAEINGKRLGVVGLGAVGAKVARVAQSLGMEVFGYDSYIPATVAMEFDGKIKFVRTLNDLFGECDYISLHVPVTEKTKGMICKESIESMKEGVRLINFADAALINEQDLLVALRQKKIEKYVSDFASKKLIMMENVILLPHMGGETEESEARSACMAIEEIQDYLEKGVIRNSVNFPSLDLAYEGGIRMCFMHENRSNTINEILAIMDTCVINIGCRSKGNVSYTIIDVGEKLGKEKLQKLKKVDGVIRIRELENVPVVNG